MKSFKWITVLGIALCLFVSCSEDQPEEPEEFDAKANLRFEIQLATSGKIIEHALESGEIISNLSYEMENISHLAFIVHSAETEGFLMMRNYYPDLFLPMTREGVTVLEEKLPFGHYFITLIASTDKPFLGRENNKRYSEAVCEIPNNHIFYKTIEIDCSLSEGIEEEDLKEDQVFPVKTELQLLTGEFVFLLPEGSKGIPTDANFIMTGEISNLPSAFFLKTGKTLTNEEMKKLELPKYNHTFEITTPFQNQLVTKYYLLANSELEDSAEERGAFEFTYKEDATSEVITKQVYFKMPAYKMDPSVLLNGFFYVYIAELYAEEKEEIRMGEEERFILE